MTRKWYRPPEGGKRLKARAVFLDRDGVINDYVRHVNVPEDLFIFPDVGKELRRLQEAGFRLFIVTNQGGIGLGFMTEKALHAIHQKLKRELAKEGVTIDGIAYCPHHPRAGCTCRKPQPTLITSLAQKYAVSLAHSYMVGDRETDVEAGRRAGTKTILIGRGPSQADFIVPDLSQAVNMILEDEKVTGAALSP